MSDTPGTFDPLAKAKLRLSYQDAVTENLKKQNPDGSFVYDQSGARRAAMDSLDTSGLFMPQQQVGSVTPSFQPTNENPLSQDSTPGDTYNINPLDQQSSDKYFASNIFEKYSDLMNSSDPRNILAKRLIAKDMANILGVSVEDAFLNFDKYASALTGKPLEEIDTQNFIGELYKVTRGGLANSDAAIQLQKVMNDVLSNGETPENQERKKKLLELYQQSLEDMGGSKDFGDNFFRWLGKALMVAGAGLGASQYEFMTPLYKERVALAEKLDSEATTAWKKFDTYVKQNRLTDPGTFAWEVTKASAGAAAQLAYPLGEGLKYGAFGALTGAAASGSTGPLAPAISGPAVTAGLAIGFGTGFTKGNIELTQGSIYASMELSEQASKIDPKIKAWTAAGMGLVAGLAATALDRVTPGLGKLLGGKVENATFASLIATGMPARVATFAGKQFAKGMAAQEAQGLVLTGFDIAARQMSVQLQNAITNQGLSGETADQIMTEFYNAAYQNAISSVFVSAAGVGIEAATGAKQIAEINKDRKAAGLPPISGKEAVQTAKTAIELQNAPVEKPVVYGPEDNPARVVPTMHMAVDIGASPDLGHGVLLTSDKSLALSESQVRGDVGLPAGKVLAALESKYPKPILDQFKQDMADGATGEISQAVLDYESATPGFNYDQLRQVAAHLDDGTGKRRGIRPAEVDQALRGMGLDSLLPKREAHTFQLDPSQTKVVGSEAEAEAASREGYAAAAWKVGDTWYGKVFDPKAARKVAAEEVANQGVHINPVKQKAAQARQKAAKGSLADQVLSKVEETGHAPRPKELRDLYAKVENLTPEQADTVTELMKNAARRLGMSWDEFQASYHAGTVDKIEVGPDGKTQAKKGMYEPATPGSLARVVLSATKGDVSTLVHELGHHVAFLMNMKKAPELGVLEGWLGKKFADWGTAEHEKWTAALEKYLYDGKLPADAKPGLAGALLKVAEWMKQVYQTLAERLKLEIPDEVRKVMDDLFARERQADTPTEKLYQDDTPQDQLDAVRAKYAETDKWMKAPNDKPTKLNERQWLQVRTDNFKKWFGDWENDPANASKVVDKNGEPLVVYHGAGKEFDTFDKKIANDKEGRKRGLGLGGGKFYFTGEKRVGEAFSRIAKERKLGNTPTLFEVFLDIKNPITEKQYQEKFKDFSGKDIWDSSLDMKTRDAFIKAVDKTLLKDGVNGTLETHRDETLGQITVFNPNQIKSATGNSGDFNPANPSILFQPEDIAKEISTIKDDLATKGVELNLTPSGRIAKLEVKKENRGTGLAKQAMQQVVNFADRVNMRLTLSPTDEWGANKSRLTEFYKSFGFVENKGKFKDYSVSETMYREPRGALFQPDDFTTKKWEKQIDLFAAGEWHESRKIELGKTPEAIQSVGLNDLPLEISPNVVEKIMAPEDQIKHGHGFTVDQVKKLLPEIYDPIAVYESKTIPGTVIALTKSLDNSGRPIIVSIHPDRKSGRNVINEIMSAYGRSGFKEHWKERLEAGAVMYYDNEKGPDWFQSIGLQSPKEGTIQGLNSSVVLKSELVNKGKGQLFQPDEEETRAAVDEGRFVPSEVLAEFSGKQWADAELSRRMSLEPLVEIARSVQSKADLQEYLKTQGLDESLADDLWTQAHAVSGAKADEWFRQWIKDPENVKKWLDTVKQAKGDAAIPARVAQLIGADGAEAKIARILSREPEASRMAYWESDYLLNREDSPWISSLEAQHFLDQLDEPAAPENRAEMPIGELEGDTLKQVMKGRVTIGSLQKKIAKADELKTVEDMAVQDVKNVADQIAAGKFVPDYVLKELAGLSPEIDREIESRKIAADEISLAREYTSREKFLADIAEQLDNPLFDDAEKQAGIEAAKKSWDIAHKKLGKDADAEYIQTINADPRAAFDNLIKTLADNQFDFKGTQADPFIIGLVAKYKGAEMRVRRDGEQVPLPSELFGDSVEPAMEKVKRSAMIYRRMELEAKASGGDAEAKTAIDYERSLGSALYPAVKETGSSARVNALQIRLDEARKAKAEADQIIAEQGKKIDRMQSEVFRAESKTRDTERKLTAKEQELVDLKAAGKGREAEIRQRWRDKVDRIQAESKDALKSAKEEARLTKKENEKQLDLFKQAATDRLQSYQERAQAYAEAVLKAEKEAHALTKVRYKMLDIAKRLTRKVGDKIDSQYADAIEEIANSIDPAFRGEKTLTRLANLRALVKATPESAKIFHQDTLNKILGKNLSEISLGELQALAKLRKELETEGRKVYKEAYDNRIMKPVYKYKAAIIQNLSGLASATEADIASGKFDQEIAAQNFRDLMDTYDLAIKYRVPETYVKMLKEAGYQAGDLVNALKAYEDAAGEKRLDQNQVAILRRQKEMAFKAFNPDEVVGSEAQRKAEKKLGDKWAMPLTWITPDRIFDDLDGWKSQGKHGPIWHMIYGASQGEHGYSAALHGELLSTMSELTKTLKANGLKISFLAKKVNFEGLTMTKDQVLEVWAATQSKQKLDALVGGNNLRPHQIEGLVAQLTPQELAVGKWILDKYQSTWERLKATGELLTGKRVKASEGVYSPIFRAETSGEELIQQTDQKAAAGAMSRTSMEEGMLKERLDLPIWKQSPIKLGLAKNFLDSFETSLRLIHGGIPIKIMDKVWNDQVVKKIVQRKFGQKVFDYVNKAIGREARPDAFKSVEKDFGDKVVNLVGKSTSLMALGFNIGSAVIQPAAVAHYLPYFKNSTVGMARIIAAFAEIAASGGAVMDKIGLMDPLMAARAIDPMINDIKRMHLDSGERTMSHIENLAYWMLQGADRITAGAGWLAIYREAKANGLTDSEAIAKARFASLQTQPSSFNLDTAEFFKDENGWKRLVTRFQGPINKVMNMVFHDIPKAATSEKGLARFKVVGYTLAGLVMMEMAMFMLKNKRPPEDEKEWEQMGGDLSFQLVPVVGPLVGAGVDGIAGTNFTQNRPSGLGQIEQALAGILKTHKDEAADVKAKVKGVLTGAGLFAPVPVGQIMKGVDASQKAADGHLEELLWLLVGGHKESTK